MLSEYIRGVPNVWFFLFFFIRRASHQSTISSLTSHGHGTAWCQQGHSPGTLYWPYGLSLAQLEKWKLRWQLTKPAERAANLLPFHIPPAVLLRKSKSWNLIWTLNFHSLNLLRAIKCLPHTRHWARVRSRKIKDKRPNWNNLRSKWDHCISYKI